jgi:FAD/FMN-containing dehydrogenase
VEGIGDVLRLAHETERPVIPRGSGYSYGDVSLNAENIVLDVSRMNRVLDWNPDIGVIQIEPGVTVGQMWRQVLEDGWWPPVVPGTMHPTLGGCAAVNAHGKNQWRVGGLVEHITDLDLMLPSGEMVRLRPAGDGELFRAAVGGLGLLGVFTRMTLQMRRVPSGLLEIEEQAVGSLEEMFATFEGHLDGADYLVGWIDAFAGGRALGRGLIQIARYAGAGAGTLETLRPWRQDLPDTLFGIVPRSVLWLGMKPTVNDVGMRLLNVARYSLGAWRSGRKTLVPHAQFQFFHDYVPNWKRSFQPGGIVQHQVFVPKDRAPSTFAALLQESQRSGFVPYLTVFKRHRSEDVLLSYEVDGYSLSLDYHATLANETRLRRMLSQLTSEVILPAGGRFYPAKDDSLNPEQLRRAFTPEAVDRFLALKRRLDPDEILQSDLYRRAIAPAP